MSKILYAAPILGLLISLPASADDTKNSNPTPRQMAHCMMARVKLDRNESYKSAFKACREEFESQPSPQVVNAMNNLEPAASGKP
jgi:hypothetical protein